MRRTATAMLSIAVALAAGPVLSAPTPREAIASADIHEVTAAVEGLFEAVGVTWNPGIEWKVGPYTTTYWWYDSGSDEILVGDMPRPEQIDSYWETWSKVLTDGNFDPAAFFASPEEAARLAHYNQFVLTTHEASHAMTYRYDGDHLKRHDYAVNCREYYADRLTVAILDDEARRDADMQRWRDRYLALVVAMGETIPDEYRYSIPGFAALDADCALIDVAQPTPDTMQPYASAYFERYRVLLEAELPSFAEMAEAHLLRPHRTIFEALPRLDERAGLAVTTLGEVNDAEIGDFDPGIVGDDMGSRLAAFAPDGTLYFGVVNYQRESGLISLAFGTDPDGAALVDGPTPWARPSLKVELTGLAVMGPELLYFCLDHWERDAADDDAEHFFTTLIEARRKGGTWTLNGISNDEGMGQCAVHRSPGGKVFYLVTPEQLSGNASRDWQAYAIDPATHEFAAPIAIGAETTTPHAIDDAGRAYLSWGYDIWRVDSMGAGGLLIGNGLRGPRDGGADEAQFANVAALQWMADGTALLLDTYELFADHRLRRIGPAN